MQTVNDFNYLGVVFNYTGSFALNQQTLSGKALRAMNVLLQNIRNFDFHPKTCCQLFDAFVASILNYSCEVWGYTKSKQLERIHLKFCKKILNVKLSTSNVGVYGDLGRYPLYISRYVRMLKYWFKLLYTDNCVLRTIFDVSQYDCALGKKNWVQNIKDLLYSHGYGDIWENPMLVNPNTFCNAFKQRLIDNFTQTWRTDVENNQKLTLYKHFKCNFEYERYMYMIQHKKYRNALAQLRLASHGLHIETGRYGRNRLERNERLCHLCSDGDIEDEYHFVFICSIYKDLRVKYFTAYYRRNPSVAKFIDLMNSDNPKTIQRLSCYVYHAFELRKTRLQNM